MLSTGKYQGLEKGIIVREKPPRGTNTPIETANLVKNHLSPPTETNKMIIFFFDETEFYNSILSHKLDVFGILVCYVVRYL